VIDSHGRGRGRSSLRYAACDIPRVHVAWQREAVPAVVGPLALSRESDAEPPGTRPCGQEFVPRPLGSLSSAAGIPSAAGIRCMCGTRSAFHKGRSGRGNRAALRTNQCRGMQGALRQTNAMRSMLPIGSPHVVKTRSPAVRTTGRRRTDKRNAIVEQSAKTHFVCGGVCVVIASARAATEGRTGGAKIGGETAGTPGGKGQTRRRRHTHVEGVNRFQ